MQRPRARLLLTLALLAVLVAPVAAHHDPERELVTIAGSKEAAQTMLPDEEVARIKALQTGVKPVGLLSVVSPDDQVVFARRSEEVGFLNLHDGGSFAPFNPGSLAPRYYLMPMFGALDFVWRDGRTLATLVIDRGPQPTAPPTSPAPRRGATPTPVPSPASVPAILLIDRLDGSLRSEPITIPRGADVIDIAPDARRLLIAHATERVGPTDLLRSVPVTWPRGSRITADLVPGSIAAAVAPEARGARLRLAGVTDTLAAADEASLVMTQADLVTLAVLDVASGATRDLRSLTPDTAVLGWSWSPDGGALALGLARVYDFNDDERRDEGRVTGGAQLAERLYRDATGDLPPEQNPLLAGNALEVFELGDGTVRSLRPAPDEGVLLFGATWSTDGTTLLVETFHAARIKGRRYPIFVPQFAQRTSFRYYDRALHELSRLDALELAGPWATVGQFVSPSEVVFAAVDGPDMRLFYHHRVSGEFRALDDRPGSHSPVLPLRGTRQIIFTYSSFTQPPALYRLDLDGSALARLTWDNFALERSLALRQDRVRFALANGQERIGTLVQPAYAPFPPREAALIVWQEGGPGGPMSNTWSATVERPFALLPSFGFALLAVPLAGREGYGPAVLNALADADNFGQIDIDEQAEIVEQMIARGWTAPGKVGITGCSYGGYFAFQSIVRHPALYAAANPQCSLVDAFDEWSRGYVALMPYLQGQPPFAKHDDYIADSPIYGADRIQAAVLTFHGSYDFLPELLPRNLHHQLLLRGVPARMVSFEGAGHGLRTTGSRELNDAYELYAAQEQIKWFRAYLNP